MKSLLLSFLSLLVDVVGLSRRLRRTVGSGLEAMPRSSQREVGRITPRGRGEGAQGWCRVSAWCAPRALAGRWRTRGCGAAARVLVLASVNSKRAGGGARGCAAGM